MTSMPCMRPVSIDTKGRHWLIKLWMLLTAPRKWVLDKPYYIQLDVLGETKIVRLPAGFVCDGASTPRLFWWLLPPTGIMLIPGLVHDYMYAHEQLVVIDDHLLMIKKVSRLEADKIFLKANYHINGCRVTTSISWLMLVCFGWIAWRKHRRAND